MPYSPTIPAIATDWDCIVDDARATLAANGTIATLLDFANHPKRIAPRSVEEGVTAPYIVLDFFWVMESTYGTPSINGLLDISCYSTGWSTTTTRALLVASLVALVNRDAVWVTTAMTAAGVALTSVNMEMAGAGFRNVDVVEPGGVMTRGKQATIRVLARKT